VARGSALSGVASIVGRINATVRNGLEIALLGGLGAAAEASPSEVVLERPVYRLKRYFPGASNGGPPVILVPPLMMSAEVWDVSPETSAVRFLHERGAQPWVVDFGNPERETGGLSRTLTDHVLAVNEAIDRVREESGRDVHAGGYCQGGMFIYQAAAYRRSAGLASIVAFGSPIDVRKRLPTGALGEVAQNLLEDLGEAIAPIFSRASIPSWMARRGFQMLDPVKELRGQIEFLTNLWDREKLLKREAQRRFLGGGAFVAYPGPALRDLLEQVVAQNRMLSGGLVIADRSVTLADITCPILVFVGKTDDIAPPGMVRGIHRAAPRAEIWEREIRAGHFGLVVGTKAAEITWPGVAAWLDWREGKGGRPEGILSREERQRTRAARVRAATPPAQLDDLRENAGLAVRLGRAALGGVMDAVTDRARMIGRLAETGLPQVARLARLARVRGRTRLSPGLVLAEQAAAHPDRTFFLFEGRAYSFADADRRIDAVVRGLISVGVRVGERIGVLMRTRPSAIAAVTAASRLGAIPVMLREGGPLAAEIAVGGVQHLVADPECAAEARRVFGRTVLVLGGGGAPRTLGPGLLDLERIDPARVELPGWYEPNPGKAGDVAVILFSGSAESLRARQITNARWALAAFGAASTAALTFRDTVYCATPLYHPTGILVCVGSALASGVRLAVASRFEPKTFWEEVRLYGATVVFYKGTMLRALVDAPFDPAERDHPVRIFAGSGMPRSIWKRVLARFGPVSVLELYTSTEARAALANLSGQKVGCVGRPFPGTAAVEVVAWDPARRTIALGPDGFARRCADGEIGLLLARAGTSADAPERPLRGIFVKGDAWVSTNDLFRRDPDGDHWIVDHVEDLIWTTAGPLPSIPIEDLVGDRDAVSLAVAYGVRLEGAAGDIPVVTIALRPGRELDVTDLTRALAALPPKERPVAVRILDEIPMTPGYRPLKGPLRREGLDPERVTRVLWLDAERGAYGWYDAAAGAATPRTARPSPYA
jgi:putative long chain acyl-CoA synthase